MKHTFKKEGGSIRRRPLIKETLCESRITILMTIDPIIIIIGILAALALVFVYFLLSTKNWIDESHHKGGASLPIQRQVENELSRLGIDNSKSVKTAQHLAEIVTREVTRETQKAQAEMEKIILQKEKTVTEIQHKYETVEQNYQKLGKQKTQTEAVVRSIAKGMIVLDDDGKVVFLNPSAEKILGYPAKDLIGKKFKNMGHKSALSMVNDEGVEDSGDDSQNAAKEEMKENTAVIETLSGQTKGVISIVPNLDANQKAEEYKNEFLAKITHELRSPLICILKSIESLSQNVTSENQTYIEIAARNVTRLEKLVNDILDLSKLEAGKIRLHHEIIALHELIKETHQSFKVWAEDKQIHLKTHMPSDPVIFEGDKNALGQVLSNLMSNALKFTPRRGTVTITAQVIEARSPGELKHLQIDVTDTGPGISEADQINIFKKFAYINTQATEGEKSTGLGLSIAKEIIKLHSGIIWVESSPDKGSKFAFSIPLKTNFGVSSHSPSAA